MLQVSNRLSTDTNRMLYATSHTAAPSKYGQQPLQAHAAERYNHTHNTAACIGTPSTLSITTPSPFAKQQSYFSKQEVHASRTLGNVKKSCTACQHNLQG